MGNTVQAVSAGHKEHVEGLIMKKGWGVYGFQHASLAQCDTIS